MRNFFRRIAVQPRHAAGLAGHPFHAVHAADGGEGAVLHPAGVQRIGNELVVPPEVGRHIGQTDFGAAEDSRINFLSKCVGIRADIARPLDGVAVRGKVGGVRPDAVLAAVYVCHDQGAVGIFLQVFFVFVLFPEFTRNPIVGVHAERIYGNVGIGRVERDRPVAVVPPVIDAEREDQGKIFVAVFDFVFVKPVGRAVHRFGVVVEHDVHAHSVYDVQKGFHIGEQIGIDLVARAAGKVYAAFAPVGIDDEDVDAVAAVQIVFDLLQGRFGSVFIIPGIPVSEHLERDHFRFAGKIGIVGAELVVASAGQENEYVRGVVVKVPSLQRVVAVGDRVAVIGGDDAGAVGKIPAAQLVRRAGDVDVGIRHAVEFPKLIVGTVGDEHVGRFRARRDMYGVLVGNDLFFRLFIDDGIPYGIPIVAVGNDVAFAVLEALGPFLLDADEGVRKELDAKVAYFDGGNPFGRRIVRIVRIVGVRLVGGIVGTVVALTAAAGSKDHEGKSAQSQNEQKHGQDLVQILFHNTSLLI